jgi:hypothetical protein
MMKRFASRFPRVRWIAAWNEPNHAIAPTRKDPERRWLDTEPKP